MNVRVVVGRLGEVRVVHGESRRRLEAGNEDEVVGVDDGDVRQDYNYQKLVINFKPFI